MGKSDSGEKQIIKPSNKKCQVLPLKKCETMQAESDSGYNKVLCFLFSATVLSKNIRL